MISDGLCLLQPVQRIGSRLKSGQTFARQPSKTGCTELYFCVKV